MAKTILCIATLDTKGPEAQYMKMLIEKRGHIPLVMDIGSLEDSSYAGDITAREVAKAAGSSIEEVRKYEKPGPAAKVMTSGAIKIAKDLYNSGRIDGILAIGGGMGSSVASAVMRELPIGFPKFILSSQKIVQAGIRGYVGTKDIGIMPSVADIAGLNKFTREALRNAVGAIVGMVEFREGAEISDKPLVFMGTVGTVTACGLKVKSFLEQKGFEVVMFHCIGVGGMTIEELVMSYPVRGVIELALNEIGNELFGGLASAGPNRLEAAGMKGIPQIIVPGHVRLIQFLEPETVPDKYRTRELIYHNPEATGVRLKASEMAMVARAVAEKLNRAKGEVKVLIPLNGFSSWDVKGTESYEAYDGGGERAFTESLKRNLNPSITVQEIDAHVNDASFARIVSQEFLEAVSHSNTNIDYHNKEVKDV